MGSVEMAIYKWIPVPAYFGLKVYCDLTGRRNQYLMKRLGLLPPSCGRDAIWFHVASVGEVSAIAPVALEVIKTMPQSDLLLTTMTRTGLERASRILNTVVCDLLPYDFIYGARRFVRNLRASALIIAETELWPNLISEARRVGTKLALVNGRVSTSAFKRYKLIGRMIAQVLQCFDCLLMKTEEDAERIRALGAPDERIMVVGNTKYDMLPPPLSEQERRKIRQSIGIGLDRRTITLGSLREGEIKKIIEALGQTIKVFRPLIIIAPRHLNYLKEIEETLNYFGYSFSTIDGSNKPANKDHCDIDAIVFAQLGKLSDIYTISDIAIIGGTFQPYGGHNPLEPASRGVVTIAGPYIDNIREDMMHLQSYGGAFVVDQEDLGEIVLNLMGNVESMTKAGQGAIEAIKAKRGASKRCVEILIERGIIEPQTDYGNER